MADSFVSGLYSYVRADHRLELRVDVDGRYPQQVVSGAMYRNRNLQVHWIAKVGPAGPDLWEGVISKKYPNQMARDSFPYTNVRIKLTRSQFPNQRQAVVEFIAGGIVDETLTYQFESPHFRKVQFEFDVLEGREAVTSYDTHSHPTHPASLPRETLTVQEVFNRAGIDMQMTRGANVVRGGAGVDAVYSDNELHDMMEQNFSLYKHAPAWEGWTFIASKYKDEHPQRVTLGIMFDTYDEDDTILSVEERFQRQGCAVFNDAIELYNNPSDPDNEAALRRDKFRTLIHEIGHQFNLLHSWQKSVLAPWDALTDTYAARSFMNYPQNYPGRKDAYYRDFEMRFIDPELLFMRHAPEPFVKMGGTAFGINHASEVPAPMELQSDLQLELRVNKDRPIFNFMEPCMVELKLTNRSDRPQIVSEGLLENADNVSIWVQKDGGEVRPIKPFARYCRIYPTKVLMPGESLYEARFISVGTKGWLIAEEGFYTVRAAVVENGQTIVSNALRLRVAPPRSYEEKYLSQDYFSNDVGRILALDGSRYLDKGNDVLRELVERFPDHEASIHARIALAQAARIPYKVYDLQQCKDGVKQLRVLPVLEKEAEVNFSKALDEHQKAASTLCHIDFKYYMDSYTEFLEQQGNMSAAQRTQEQLYNTLATRGAHYRVLREIKDRQDEFQGTPTLQR